MASILEGLNEAQRAAVTSDADVVQILAPPGSGKTKTLTSRVAYLLQHHDYKPWNIICLTFTIKSAQEMRDRVSKILGDGVARKLVLGTFHSVCRRYLVSYGHLIHIRKGFGIADTTDTLGIIRRLVKRFKSSLEAKTVQARISRTKSKGLTCDDLFRDERARRHQEQREFLTIFEEYERQLATSNLLDYDDLLVRCNDLLQAHPECVSNVEAVLIDEFQDTNTVQFDLMTSFAVKQKRVTTVGDMDQSIYGWRSAEIKNLERMQERYPDTLVMQLKENYRSSGAILLCANEVIDQDPSRPQKAMVPTHCPGTMPVLRKIPSADVEAAWIVSEIQRASALSGGLFSHSDFAILLRTASLSRLIETSLGKAGIPYRMVGGHRFYERAEIKVLLDYLRVICLPTNADAITRVINIPARGVGDASIKLLFERAEVTNTNLWRSLLDVVRGSGSLSSGLTPSANKGIGAFMGVVLSCQSRLGSSCNPASPGELLRLVIKKLNFKSYLEKIHKEDHEARWSNVEELLSQTMDFEVTKADGQDEDALPNLDDVKQTQTNASEDALARFLANVALATDVQKEYNEENEEGPSQKHQVTISTIHAAKGLEWPVVFVPSAYEGCIPHSRAEDMDEERRLLYVAMTRAQAMLYLSYPLTNSRRDETTLSHFLVDRKVQPFLSNQGPSVDSFVVDDIARILRRECPSWPDILNSSKDLDSFEDNKWALDGSESVEVIQARLARYAESGKGKFKHTSKRTRGENDSTTEAIPARTSVDVGYTTTMQTASAFSLNSNVGFTTASLQMESMKTAVEAELPAQHAQKKRKRSESTSQRDLFSLWRPKSNERSESANGYPHRTVHRKPDALLPRAPQGRSPTSKSPTYVKIDSAKNNEPLLPLLQSRQLPKPKEFRPALRKPVEEAACSKGYLLLSSSPPLPEDATGKQHESCDLKSEGQSQAVNFTRPSSYICPTSVSMLGNAPRKTLGVRRTVEGWPRGGRSGFSVPTMKER